MLRIATLGAVLSLSTSGAFADEWVKLDGSEVEAALDERSLKYKTATQKFYKSGRTLYDSGRPSWGNWRIQGDQYCSEWPPNAGWECFDFERRINSSDNSVTIRFISKSGSVTEGTYLE